MEKRRITKFIKNEVGSDRVPEDGGSWIDYWFRKTGYTLPFVKCPTCGCILDKQGGMFSEKAEGAHIRLSEGLNLWSNKVYIVPMCHDCNCQFGKILQVKNGCEDIVVVEEICKS